MNYYIQNSDDKIVLFDTDRTKLQTTITFMPQYQGLEILETEKEIVSYNNEFVFKEDVIEELLQEAKDKKNQENTEKAKEAVENGYVLFKDAQFETNAQTVGDLTATMLLMQASGLETYSWLSKDDKVVELTLEDFGTLGGIIAGYKNSIWNTKYVEYKTQIELAETLEEVEAIVIDFTVNNELSNA